MSHFSVYKTQLKGITFATAQAALQGLASKLGAEIVDYVNNYYGGTTSVPIGFKIASLPRGIGFSVENGTLCVHGDPYGNQQEWHRIETLAQNYIKAYVAAQKARMMFPSATAQFAVDQADVKMKLTIPED